MKIKIIVKRVPVEKGSKLVLNSIHERVACPEGRWLSEVWVMGDDGKTPVRLHSYEYKEVK